MALAIPLALSLRDRVGAEVRAQASNQASLVGATAAELLGPARRGDLRRLTRSAARSVRGRVIVVDGRGGLLADSTGAGRTGFSYRDRPEINRALQGRSAQNTRRSSTLSEDILATAVPILRGGRPAGAVRVTQSVSAVGRATRRAILGLAIVAGIVLLLGLGAGMLIAGQVARPLRRLDLAARRIAAGDLDARAAVEGSSEQRSLARTFNEMTGRLARMLRGQQEFVADASHQLRTPLTGLRLRLEEARAASPPDGPAAREIEAGMREVDRMAEILEELLVLSRAGERELPGERVDLRAAAMRAGERWRPAAAEAGIDLEVADGAHPAHAWCAAADLDRALDMVVENALRYSPRGKHVTLATRPGAVEVADEGPGLAPGEEEAVFDRFHRGRASRGGPAGTGLGLPIARELAREWGGTVTLANRPGGGAVARLELRTEGPRKED